MLNAQFFVVPITHVDLAWKRGRDEMSEMLEIVIVRLLDSLENDPNFKYQLEQAAHFRELQKRRPDLIARLQPFLENGRLEFVGGMASTLENNLPNGECCVRNQAMGLDWIKKTWGVRVETGWLLDTFGINAQMPQILRGFGLKWLMANRFGGAHIHDLFRARGLDGTQTLVAGWGTYAAFMRRENLSERFCTNWDDIQITFDQADKLSGVGPFMVIPYTENEMLVSRRPAQLAKERNRDRAGQTWKIATPGEYFAAVEESEAAGRVLPVVAGDLNPEFTGCFSLRQPIRLRNRAVETRLLEAEKWVALAKIEAPTLEEAWWQLHYVQFHDVFTGSHPTPIFHEVMAILDEIEERADAVLQSAFATLAPFQPENEAVSVVAFNGLPWARRGVLEMSLPPGFEGVSRVLGPNGAETAFEIRDGKLRIGADVPAGGFQGFTLEKGALNLPSWQEVESASLENDLVKMDFDAQNGISKLIWKPSGAVLMENAGTWLVAQRDDGNFQIENPASAEVAASSGSLKLKRLENSVLGQTVRLSGGFPPLIWAEADNHLRWSAEWFLASKGAAIQLKLSLDWRGEATRVRLCLPTQIEAATGIFEIPFGTVARKSYSPRTNAKGEWPAHRFVTIENNGHGVALLNTGVAGVEVSGGAIFTTLLRAPKNVYAGMERDETSSQHGHHEYRFALVPYAGSWAQAGVAKAAQELNNPLHGVLRNGENRTSASFFSLEPDNVVLSGVKAASDGAGACVVRVYETAGRPCEAVLRLEGAREVWECDLAETRGAAVETQGGEWRFAIAPFEIKSFWVMH